MIPFRISLISMAFSLSVGFFTSSHNDNTCLEQVETLADSIHPNILFLIDHSGSMLNLDLLGQMRFLKLGNYVSYVVFSCIVIFLLAGRFFRTHLPRFFITKMNSPQSR
jgi:hypothetical protein